MTNTKHIPTKLVRSKILSPKQFLQTPTEEVQRSYIIPPKLGSRSFGKIKVEFKNARFEPVR